MSDQKTSSSQGEAIRVVVRCRPFIKSEAKNCKDRVRINGKEGVIRVGDHTKKDFDETDISTWRDFTYDTVYDKNGSQEEVYKKSVEPIFHKVLQGFNSTIFCYGQTSSGKTYTMMGDLSKRSQYGIVPKITEEMFKFVESSEGKYYDFTINLSFLEIYNEKVFDLLSGSRRELKIRQTRSKGFHVPKLTKFQVKSAEQMFKLIHAGFKNRSTAATSQNAESSRSHSMLTVSIEKAPKEDGPKAEEGKTNAKLNLVDLAGSERYHSGSEQQAKESTSINQSLSTLANVISALAQNKKTFIPYRNSSLTKLLKDALGGSASTLMFANINPCGRNAPETVSTLRYASRAKKIKNKPKVQIYLDPKNAMMAKMRDEIERLKQMLSSKDSIIEKLKGGDYFNRRDSSAWKMFENGIGEVKAKKMADKEAEENTKPKQEEKVAQHSEYIGNDPQLDFFRERHQELTYELNESKQREIELDQEIEALNVEVQKLERKEIEQEDEISLLGAKLKQASHRETHLKKQIDKYKSMVENKFKEKIEIRQMVDMLRTESEVHKKEKLEVLQLLEDGKVHTKYLKEQLEREQADKMAVIKQSEKLKEERDQWQEKYLVENEKTEDLCLQLVECRNTIEAERKAAEEALKTVDLKAPQNKRGMSRRRQSLAVRFTKETKAGLNGLVSPNVSPRGSPSRSNLSQASFSMNSRASMSNQSTRSAWAIPRKLIKTSMVLNKLPRAFRASFLHLNDVEVKEKKLDPMQSTWGSGLAQFMNLCLETETDLVVAGLVPIKIGDYFAITQLSNPFLVARYLNVIGRIALKNYFDETKIKYMRNKERFGSVKDKITDLQLVLGACKSAGINIGKLNPLQLTERETSKKKNNPLSIAMTFDPNSVLDLAQRMIQFQLSQRINLSDNPELENLTKFKGWGLKELTITELKELSKTELVLRWVNRKLFDAIQFFEERGQNLESVLEASGIQVPLQNFSDDWGMMVPVLIMTGIMGTNGQSESAVSFAAQVMVEEDFATQVEILEDQMRSQGGHKALCFFLGDVDIEELKAKEREFVCEKMNLLFSMAVLNECAQFGHMEAESEEDDDDDYDEFDQYSSIGVREESDGRLLQHQGSMREL
eukprot:CAMPEP_0167756870 /NCGR_PEP_ID=MMETSP0110_2-20121227/9618_1 /TAXON_ID=629695 /ORGANISM="Gymnochlora sp., Strain CCMP2014" /LENGTH=1114 /DNA_ID=CAMNT_0007643013 /DNA_START=30 /DNA_END=3374 /DNA_ORIENTATION=-